MDLPCWMLDNSLTVARAFDTVIGGFIRACTDEHIKKGDSECS